MMIERPQRHVVFVSRRLARLTAAVVTVSMIGAACASSASETSETTDTSEVIVDADDSDTFIETTDEPNAPSTTEADAVRDAPDTTIERTQATPDPEFAVSITQIDIDAGTVTISNHGDADVDLGEIWLCEFPAYAQLDAGSLAAGDQVTIPNPHGSSADDGELGLYRTDDFAAADAMLSYVEWGSAGHMRASVAAEAGVWGDAAVDPGLVLGTSGAFAVDASRWAVLTPIGGESAPGAPSGEPDDSRTDTSTPEPIPEDDGAQPESPADPPPDDYAPAAPQPPPDSTPSEPPPPPPDDY